MNSFANILLFFLSTKLILFHKIYSALNPFRPFHIYIWEVMELLLWTTLEKKKKSDLNNQDSILAKQVIK